MWLERWRRFQARRRATGAMRPYLRVPSPSLSQAAWDVPWLVVDLETTGLNPKRDEIISIGWVPVRHGRVELQRAQQLFVRPERSVGQSAAIHHLRDQDLAEAIPLAQALVRLLAALAGKLLVVHHAPLDRSFLNRACEKHFHAPLVALCADTLAFEQRLIERTGSVIVRNQLRLDSCRARYHLPAYPAHDALTDALATAELMLAQLAYRTNGHPLTLAEYGCRFG